MPEARVISRLEVPNFMPGGRLQVQTQITYVMGIQPPRTIYLDKQNPTDEEVVAAIRADQSQPEPPGTGIIQI